MEIILGKTAGFCGGVKIAVDRAEKELKENKELYCLGELVHNREITNKLKNMGLLTVNDIMEVPDQKVVIIRAHGEPPRTYEEAKKRNIKIIDLTCPKVIKIHEKVEEYASKKYYIILIAEKEHPESIGTYGFCGEYAYIVKDENDVKEAVLEIEKTKIKNILMISQTTFSMEKFDYLVEKIKEDIGRDVNIVIDKSICDYCWRK
jgi:4-hydroxy-3-methylbut-2-enyl diphosphate reductase